METLTTHGIRISVESAFQDSHSDPRRGHFLHVYDIRIENINPFPVQLLYRKWYIAESDGSIKEVEGEGVIGRQPIIQPNGFHEYSSYCVLKTDIGKMSGTYTMFRLDDGTTFDVVIPPFILPAPYRLS